MKKIFNKYYDEKYYSKMSSLQISDGYSETRALKALKYMNKKSKILNIGCGAGFESAVFKKAGHYVVGIDVSEKALKIAKNKQDESYLVDIQEETDFEDSSFDVIYAGEVLEHLAFPSYFFEEVYRLLVRGVTHNNYTKRSIFKE